MVSYQLSQIDYHQIIFKFQYMQLCVYIHSGKECLLQYSSRDFFCIVNESVLTQILYIRNKSIVKAIYKEVNFYVKEFRSLTLLSVLECSSTDFTK